jgi:hypothetical protein
LERGRVELANVKTDENRADIMTKNLGVSKFKSNGRKLLEGEIMHKEINMIETLEIEVTRRENVWSHLE